MKIFPIRRPELAHFALPAVFVLALSAVPVQAQKPGPINPDKTGGAQAGPAMPDVTLVVTVKRKGKAVANAKVIISSQSGLAPVMGKTNASGVFNAGLMVGSYTFTATSGKSTGKKDIAVNSNTGPVEIDIATPKP